MKKIRDIKMKNATDTKVRRSSAGLGLYAAKDFARGDTVIEYIGHRLRGAHDRDNRYLFRVSKTIDIDGSPRWNTARYVNHACRPNCEAINRRNRIFLVAKKSIKAGEELTYDYGKEYFSEYIEPGGCRCASCLEKNLRA